jgi:hydroxyacylglutathione hydrolase
MKTEIIPVSLGFVKAFLVKGERTVVVDSGFNKRAPRKILRAMRANGIRPSDVSLLLVTHAHGDHTGGLAVLKELTGAPVAVHASETEFLEAGRNTPGCCTAGFPGSYQN